MFLQLNAVTFAPKHYFRRTSISGTRLKCSVRAIQCLVRRKRINNVSSYTSASSSTRVLDSYSVYNDRPCVANRKCVVASRLHQAQYPILNYSCHRSISLARLSKKFTYVAADVDRRWSYMGSIDCCKRPQCRCVCLRFDIEKHILKARKKKDNRYRVKEDDSRSLVNKTIHDPENECPYAAVDQAPHNPNPSNYIGAIRPQLASSQRLFGNVLEVDSGFHKLACQE
ncbi:hypothetical protein O6H91_20G029000 [Diphasiastrum complanatum]|uniref:Uncharacterized protein n=1 Tax=Diphasiastrum complanatum TaxID=34168 RepID=A0ACC2AP04_DIPCM|nr:hypothetical protein O6H91_20G029000 [Diphasiastrum complanatum]